MHLIRSFLFAPGNQPQRLQKFPDIPADCFVIDLEDGTPEADKAAARAALADNVAALRQRALQGLLCARVNAPDSAHHAADMQAALNADIDAVVVPKIEQPRQVEQLGKALADAEARRGRPLALIGGIESVAGVAAASALATADAQLRAVYFGAEDFITEMGGRRTPQGLEVLYARSQVVLAAKAAGIQALDQAVIEIRDDARFGEDAAQGRNLGYGGKICLLPRQVELANALFAPDAAEVERARRLLAAAAGRGVTEFEGRMIDAPLLKRAQSIVDLAERRVAE